MTEEPESTYEPPQAHELDTGGMPAATAADIGGSTVR